MHGIDQVLKNQRRKEWILCSTLAFHSAEKYVNSAFRIFLDLFLCSTGWSFRSSEDEISIMAWKCGRADEVAKT